jgi:hypothetical protein
VRRCRTRHRATLSNTVSGDGCLLTPAHRGGCFTNLRRAHWSLSKGGFEKAASRRSPEAHPAQPRRCEAPQRRSQRAQPRFSQTPLRNSLRAMRAPHNFRASLALGRICSASCDDSQTPACAAQCGSVRLFVRQCSCSSISAVSAVLTDTFASMTKHSCRAFADVADVAVSRGTCSCPLLLQTL